MIQYIFCDGFTDKNIILKSFSCVVHFWLLTSCKHDAHVLNIANIGMLFDLTELKLYQARLQQKLGLANPAMFA